VHEYTQKHIQTNFLRIHIDAKSLLIPLVNATEIDKVINNDSSVSTIHTALL